MQVEFQDREREIIAGLLMLAKRGADMAKDKANSKLAKTLINKFQGKSVHVNLKPSHLEIVSLIVVDAVEGADQKNDEDMRNISEEDEVVLKGAAERLAKIVESL